MSDNHRRRSAISVAQAVTSVVIVGILTAGIVYASEIILTLFLATLFGVFLSRLARVIDRWISLPKGWSVGIVVLLLLTASIATISLFYVQIDQQIDAASEQIEGGIEELRSLRRQFRQQSARS